MKKALIPEPFPFSVFAPPGFGSGAVLHRCSHSTGVTWKTAKRKYKRKKRPVILITPAARFIPTKTPDTAGHVREKYCAIAHYPVSYDFTKLL
jgi:hypothetical protein